MPEATPSPGRAPLTLLHPLPIAAILLLILNDHYLKAAYPGWWTGKVSDFAGLLFFPIFLQALWQQLSPMFRRFSPSAASVLVTTSIATSVIFAAIQLWHPASDAYRVGLAALQWPFLSLHALLQGDVLPAIAPVHMVADPSDLIALPAAFVAVMLVWRSTPADSDPCPN